MTNFVIASGGSETTSTAVDILNSGTMNFRTVSEQGRIGAALNTINIHNDSSTDDAGGYTIDGFVSGNVAQGPFVAGTTNPARGVGIIAVNEDQAGNDLSRMLTVIIHETLHLDEEINNRRETIVDLPYFDGLDENDRIAARGIVEHLLINETVNGIAVVSDDFRYRGAEASMLQTIADSRVAIRNSDGTLALDTEGNVQYGGVPADVQTALLNYYNSGEHDPMTFAIGDQRYRLVQGSETEVEVVDPAGAVVGIAQEQDVPWYESLRNGDIEQAANTIGQAISDGINAVVGFIAEVGQTIWNALTGATDEATGRSDDDEGSSSDEDNSKPLIVV